MGSSHSLALSALAAWLLAELLGAYMLRNWIRSGAVRHRREHPEGISLPVLAGHAGLNLAGLSCWIGFVLTRSAIPAWLGICLLVPGIGLGVSTVSIWTPYPVARRGPDQSADEEPGPAGDPGSRPEAVAGGRGGGIPAGRRAAGAQPGGGQRAEHRGLRLDPRTIVPLAHGVLAIATFLLAVLAAISAR